MGSIGSGNSNVGQVIVNDSIDRLSNLELASGEAAINKRSFQKTGNGVWEFTGPYLIGAQILDETGTSRALHQGFLPNQKVYSVHTWGQAAEDTRITYATTLNEAKTAAKEEMKKWLRSVNKNTIYAEF